MKQGLLKIIIILPLLVFLFVPRIALADGCNIGELLPPCACSGNCQLNDFLALASNLAQWGVGILAGIVVGLLIYGGFGMMMSFGNAEKIEANKKLLGGTFRGLAIVLLGWVIVNTIIFFLTGNGDGLLYKGADEIRGPWWHFTETSPCPKYQESENTTPIQQQCVDVENDANWEAWKKTRHCETYGVCPGDKYEICCNPS